MEPKRPAPRLYLITSRLDDTAAFARELGSALGAVNVAAVLLRLANADERTLINRAKALGAIVQDRGVAFLLEDRADIVARAGADGAHLSDVAALQAALPILKPARIAGAGGLVTRHDAMVAGEAGADYVMFGAPDRSGRRPSFAAIEDRVAWWAELFEIPCVGFAGTLDEVSHLVRAGADFVALGDWVWTDPRGPVAIVATAAERLAEPVG
jgi:thiamine-phosphate pyrophosphorylase